MGRNRPQKCPAKEIGRVQRERSQQRIALAPQAASSDQKFKEGGHTNTKGGYDYNPKKGGYDYNPKKGATAQAVSNAIHIALPLVTAAYKYFGFGLSAAEQAERLAAQPLPKQEAGEELLDKQDKKAILEEVRAATNSIEETYKLFVDRRAADIDRLNRLPKAHNEPEIEIREDLRAALESTTKMRDDAFALTAGLSKLHREIDRRRPFTQKDKVFVKKQMATLKEAIEPIEEALLFKDGSSPKRQQKQQRKQRPLNTRVVRK